MSAHTRSSVLIANHPLQSTFIGVPEAEDLLEPKSLWQSGLDEWCTQDQFDALSRKWKQDEMSLRNTLLAAGDIGSHQPAGQTVQQAANACWGYIAMLSRATWDVIENDSDEKLIESQTAIKVAYETYQTNLGGQDDLTNINAVVKAIQNLAGAHLEAVTKVRTIPRTQYSSIRSNHFIKPTEGSGEVDIDKTTYRAGELGGFTSNEFCTPESNKPIWQAKPDRAGRRAYS